eukprot:s709_g33.t1
MATSAWENNLEAAKVPEDVRSKLMDLGFDTEEAFQFKDEATFEQFAQDLLVAELKLPGVTADNWSYKPLVQKLRALWQRVAGSGKAQTQALPVQSALVCALPSPPQPGKALTVADRDRLRRELEKKYSGCLVDLETLPAMSFLNTVKNQHDNKAWDWVPWKKVLSEKVASTLKEGKNPIYSLEALMLASCQEDVLDRDISSAPYPILQRLQVRAHAYAMVGSGHLGSWNLYNSRFMKFYTNDPGPHFRFCTAQEAEEADQCALREVFGLCFAGATLDDALSTVAVDRDMLRSLLMPRPKLEKPPAREALKRKRPSEPSRVGEGRRKATGIPDPPHLEVEVSPASPSPPTEQCSDVPEPRPQPAHEQQSLRVNLRDGGGILSTADWFQPHEADLGSGMRQQWWQRIQDWNLVQRLEAQVQTRARTPLLNDEEVSLVRNDLAVFLKSKGAAHNAEICPGQPLCLGLLQGCLELWKDLDLDLPRILAEGVPTGILQTIHPSGVWRETEVAERPPTDLQIWNEPWSSGLANPDLLVELVQADVDEGFAEWVDGGLAEIERRFGSAVAAGKLGVVQKPGSAARLIGDSSISGANEQCRISERIELPTLSTVAQFVSSYPQEDWLAFSLDFNKAHKRVKVHPAEQGLSSFCVKDSSGNSRWAVYKVCHFGAAWSAYWWSRVAAAFIRVAHRFLHHSHFLCIYVDDALALFPRRVAAPMACLVLVLACAIGFPLSWHKVDLGHKLTWIGWDLVFRNCPCAELPEQKRRVLLEALWSLSSSPKKVPRKEFQALIGRLVWFTSGASWLRPWLQPLFFALNKPRLHFQALDSLQVKELVSKLSPSGSVVSKCQHCDVQQGWRLLEHGGQPFVDLNSLLCAKQKHGKVWAKFGEPMPICISLSKEEIEVMRFLYAIIQKQEPIHLAETPGPACVAAADAFAEGPNWGIGGWFLCPSDKLAAGNIWWFSVQLKAGDLPPWFKSSSGDLQGCIAALEALAQLVLLACQQQHFAIHSASQWVSLRQWCDNMGVVASSHKGLSLKQPLARVLQSIALFASEHHLTPHLRHVAGERNVWADRLSRGLQLPGLDAGKQLRPDWLGLLNLGWEAASGSPCAAVVFCGALLQAYGWRKRPRESSERAILSRLSRDWQLSEKMRADR